MILVRKFVPLFFLSLSGVGSVMGMEEFFGILNGRVEKDKKPATKVTRSIEQQTDRQIWEQIERDFEWEERERKKSVCRYFRKSKL